MLRKSSSDVRFDLRVLMETFRGGQKGLHFVSVDQGKQMIGC